MKVRKLRKLRQEKHGYFDTKSWRTPPLYDYDPFTGQVLKGKSLRFSIGTSGRHTPWKVKPWKRK